MTVGELIYKLSELDYELPVRVLIEKGYGAYEDGQAVGGWVVIEA